MNGLPAIANNLATQGRYGDSMLVHMNPQEVGGLQALAQANGTSLTTNPDTGLPEAFKLKDLLPTLAGIGLSFIPGVGPLMAGGIVGGVETLRTGDLGRGLMAGLGAFGGAGMGSALSATGAQAAAASALPAGGATATGIAAPSASGSLLSQSLSAPAASAVPGAAGSSFLQTAGSTLPANVFSPGAVSALETTAADQFAKQGMFSQLGQGAKAAFNDPRMFASNLNTAFPSTTAKIAAATPPFMALSETFSPKMPMPTPEKSNYKGPQRPTERRVSYPGQLSSREWNYFDPSNPMPFADGGAVDRAVQMPTDTSMTGSVPEFNYNFRPVEIQGQPFQPTQAPTPIGGKGGVFQRVIQMVREKQGRPSDLSGYDYDPMTQSLVKMARGGSVPQLEDGGFVLTKKAVDGLGQGSNRQGQRAAAMGLGALPIKGKGHGTSDSIKTTIDGKVPARVSNGEAYVPRSNVQRAGGAKKLYALMKKAERKA